MAEPTGEDEPAAEAAPLPSPAAGQTAPPQPGTAEVDPRLLEILVCPLTKTRLRYDRERRELVSKAAGLAYPIREGVPLMTMEAARQIDEA